MLPSYCLSSSRLSSPFSPFESNPFFISSLGRLGIHGIRKNDLRSSRISLTVAPPPPFSPRVAVCDRVYIYIYIHTNTRSRGDGGSRSEWVTHARNTRIYRAVCYAYYGSVGRERRLLLLARKNQRCIGQPPPPSFPTLGDQCYPSPGFLPTDRRRISRISTSPGKFSNCQLFYPPPATIRHRLKRFSFHFSGRKGALL